MPYFRTVDFVTIRNLLWFDRPRTYWVRKKVADGKGKLVDDVQISFGLVSPGQFGEATSGHWGRFWKALSVGEYVAVPVKIGYAFEPESIAFQLSPKGKRMEFKAVPP